MRKLKWFLIGVLAVVSIMMMSHWAYGTKAFTFFDQTFQVPNSWPSETEMKALPMKELNQGRLTRYYFVQKEPKSARVYWFAGTKTSSGFDTKLLSLVFHIGGGMKCTHWVVNSDGTITQIDCLEFGVSMALLEQESI